MRNGVGKAETVRPFYNKLAVCCLYYPASAFGGYLLTRRAVKLAYKNFVFNLRRALIRNRQLIALTSAKVIYRIFNLAAVDIFHIPYRNDGKIPKLRSADFMGMSLKGRFINKLGLAV